MADFKKKCLSISIPHDSQVLENQRQSINHFLRENKVSEDIISSIELALYEVVINVIEHGSPEYRDTDISISCSLTRKKITLVINYSGDIFDITTFKLPDIVSHYKAGKKRGLGIYFIRTLIDDVKYTFRQKKNTVTMIKYR